MRLLAYQRGLRVKPIKPENISPPAGSSRSDPTNLSKHDHVAPEYKEKSKQEIQANAFLCLAREYYKKKQTEEAEENLENALKLIESAPENRFSQDMISEIYFLQGYLMLQKNKLKSAYSSFNTFLQQRDQFPVQDAQLRLEIARILMCDGKDLGLEASEERITNSLADNTDIEQLILKAQSHQVVSEYYFEHDWHNFARYDGIECLKILEAPELRNSSFGPEITRIKLEVAKVLVKNCERVQIFSSNDGIIHEDLLRIAKILQETKAELETHRETFALIIGKCFEVSARLGNKEEIPLQEILGILRESKFEERDFSSKNEYLEYIISVANGMLSLEYYTEGSKLLNQILKEELEAWEISKERLVRYFYLKSQYADEKKEYQEVLTYKRLYLETRNEKTPFYQPILKSKLTKYRRPDLHDLNSYIIGIKANVKLGKLDEAVKELPLCFNEYFGECYILGGKNNGSRVDLREFLAKNIEDVRWEKWLKEMKSAEEESRSLVDQNRERFISLNMLMLCAKNKEFTLVEDCADIIKKSEFDDNLPSDLAKKSDFVLRSGMLTKCTGDCIEFIGDLKVEKGGYLVSLLELIPIFSQKRLMRGNVFILEEVEKVIQDENISSPALTGKLETIRALIYSDLEEYSAAVKF